MIKILFYLFLYFSLQSINQNKNKKANKNMKQTWTLQTQLHLFFLILTCRKLIDDTAKERSRLEVKVKDLEDALDDAHRRSVAILRLLLFLDHTRWLLAQLRSVRLSLSVSLYLCVYIPYNLWICLFLKCLEKVSIQTRSSLNMIWG